MKIEKKNLSLSPKSINDFFFIFVSHLKKRNQLSV